MYQPAHGRFAVPDPARELARLVGEAPVTLVTLGPDGLRASILPMLYDPDDGPHGTLRGHLARPNPQWRDIRDDVEPLVIADGPDAYVSPSWYPSKRRAGREVPTWDYATVHAYGSVAVRHEPEWLEAVVRRLTDRHESRFPHPWSVDDAPGDYIATMLRAIVGIELRIGRLEAKRKLSQNRSDEDMAGVVAGLSGGTERDRLVAAEVAQEVEREARAR
jgi:transcriptional regulator